MLTAFPRLDYELSEQLESNPVCGSFFSHALILECLQCSVLVFVIMEFIHRLVYEHANVEQEIVQLLLGKSF